MDDYELLDVGEGMRLERFGERIVARPHPAAIGERRTPAAWNDASLTYDSRRLWTGPYNLDPWQVRVDGLTVELRPTTTGQVGLFPEQQGSWSGSGTGSPGHGRAQPVRVHRPGDAGYGGGGRLCRSRRRIPADGRLGAAERGAVGLAGRPVRWIVDDAKAFVARELRRGRRYDGVILDPPSYGHGPRGRGWRLEDDLAPLLRQVAELVTAEGFVLLTAHTPGFGPEHLADVLAAPFGVSRARIDRGPLQVTARTGARLELGAFARWPGAR